MAGYVADKAAGNVFRDIQGEWHTATGTTTANHSASDAESIDWNNLNYPPWLRLFHYDLSELPSTVTPIVRCMHIASIVTLTVLVLNFLDVIIVVAAYKSSGFNIAFSCLDFFIFCPLSTFTFYAGYRSMAMTGSFKTTQYMIAQCVMIVFSLYFALSPSGPFNGFLRFAFGDNYGYWIFAVLCESLLWLSVFVMGCWSAYRVYTFDPYHSQQARAVGRR